MRETAWVHVSAAVNEEDKFIAQASGQHVVCDTDLGGSSRDIEWCSGGHAR